MPSGRYANQGGGRRKHTPLGIIAGSACRWLCRMRHNHLYVILDIYSRYVVGWLIARRESAELAEQLIADTVEKENIAPGTLTLHADRGTSMRSKPVAALLIDLEVAKTHSRPHVSDDNPYSEAQFKTLKYRPDFPDRFGSIEMLALTVSSSSAGTTMIIVIAGSAGWRPPPCMTEPPRLSRRSAPSRSMPPSRPHPIRFKGCTPKPPVLPTAAWDQPTENGSPTAARTLIS